MKPKIAVAISGGVDSLMAAYLLKNQGHEIIGLHFVTGFESGQGQPFFENQLADVEKPDFSQLKMAAEKRLEPLCRQLEIPIRVLDLQKEFRQCVISYFVDTYGRGQTPNPCLVCNPGIKFGPLLDHARKLGAEALATGHYARVEKSSDGTYSLFRGVDRKKDQSYFLAFLNADQLARARFPLGGMTKQKVLGLAEKSGLGPVTEQESQDVCFIGGKDYREFISKIAASKPGAIVDSQGNQIGRHQGLHGFTIGQRRGINCPAKAPYYVLRLDMTKNQLVVGFEKELYKNSCRVRNINWIETSPETPLRIQVKIRYRHKPCHATVFAEAENRARVRFDTPQAAVTPGQGAVFYLGDKVLGGGWITWDRE